MGGAARHPAPPAPGPVGARRDGGRRLVVGGAGGGRPRPGGGRLRRPSGRARRPGRPGRLGGGRQAAQRAGDRDRRRPGRDPPGDAQDAALAGRRRGHLHPGVRDHPELLPVAGVDPQRPLRPQPRRAPPAAGRPARPADHPGPLPARRRLPHGHGRQVPQPLAPAPAPARISTATPWPTAATTTSCGQVDGAVRRVPTYSTTFIGDQALAYLGEFERDDARPWFLYLATFAPHDPRVPEPKYADGQLPGPGPGRRRRRRRRWPARPPTCAPAGAGGPAEAAKVRTGQLRTLLSVDDLVDRVLRRLQATGELDDTLVFFLSDNGYAWGEHGHVGKFTPYTESIKVPFLVRWPGRLPAGTVDDRLVATIDIKPTVLAAAGIRPERGDTVDGRSLLDGRRRERLLAEYWRDQANAPGIRDWAALRTRRLAVHRELRPAGRLRHLPGVLRPAPRPGHGAEPARRRRPRQRPAGRHGRRAGRRPHLRGGELPMSRPGLPSGRPGPDPSAPPAARGGAGVAGRGAVGADPGGRGGGGDGSRPGSRRPSGGGSCPTCDARGCWCRWPRAGPPPRPSASTATA